LDWSVNVGAGVPEPPAVDSQNGIYLGDQNGVALKYNSSGGEVWKYDTLSGQIFMSPVLNGPRVMVGAANAGLHLLDARTGKRDAVFAPEEYPMSQASDLTGNAFFYSFDEEGTVFAFGPRGRRWWSFATGAGSTVNAVAIASDGKVLVSNSQTLKAYVGPVLGDLNCDGGLNAFDVGPFILALTDPAGYASRYPACSLSLADINGDGAVDLSDIASFVHLFD
jgi:outer membrane protein assembly factor BamB